MEPTPTAPLSIPVLLGGLVTTAVALALTAWLLFQFNVNVMGFTFWFVLPVGALVVGVAAGSGYGLAAWTRGVRIGGATLLVVAVLQALAFVAAQYAEYRAFASYGGPMPDFLGYIDETTRSISFSRRGKTGGAIGGWGYAVRAVEFGGFMLGALLVPLGMRALPYCDDCARYMKTDRLGALPASVERPKKFDSPQAEADWTAASTEARERAIRVHDHLVATARAGDPAAFADAARAAKSGWKQTETLPQFVRVDLSECPSCRKGILETQMHTQDGDKTSLDAMETADLSPAFVEAVTSRAAVA